MAVSPYSVVTAALWATLAVLLGRAALRKAGAWGPGTAALLFLLAGVRLLAPLELEGSAVLRSRVVYPALRNWACRSGVGSGLLLLWAAGAAVRLAGLARQLADQRRFRRAGTLQEDGSRLLGLLGETAAELGYGGPARLAVTERASTAYQTGFFRPYILLPAESGGFSDEDLRNMLRHELCHFLSGDLWIKTGLRAAGCVLWWHPVMPGISRDVEQLLELRCDRRACRDLDEAGRLSYLDTLLRLLRRGPGKSGGASVGYRGGMDMVQRFQMLLDGPERIGRGRRLALWGMCAALFAASYGVTLQPWAASPALDGEAQSLAAFDLTPGSYTVVRGMEGYELYRDTGDYYCHLSRLAALTPPFCRPEAAVPDDTPLGQALGRTVERERALCAVSPAEETTWRVRKRHGSMQKRLWSNTRGQWRTEWIICCSSTGVVSRGTF